MARSQAQDGQRGCLYSQWIGPGKTSQLYARNKLHRLTSREWHFHEHMPFQFECLHAFHTSDSATLRNGNPALHVCLNRTKIVWLNSSWLDEIVKSRNAKVAAHSWPARLRFAAEIINKLYLPNVRFKAVGADQKIRDGQWSKTDCGIVHYFHGIRTLQSHEVLC